MSIFNRMGLHTAKEVKAAQTESFGEGEELGLIKGREQYMTAVAGPSVDKSIFAWSVAQTGNNPDPVLFREARNHGLDYYRDILMKDQQAQTIVRRRKDRVLALDRKVMASTIAEDGPDENDERLARFTRAWMDNLAKLKQVWEDMLEADAMGYSVSEVIWGDAIWEGMAVFWPVAIQKRDQNYFSFEISTHDLLYDPNRFFTPGSSMQNMDERFPGKFIRMSFGPTNNPWGEALMRNLHSELWRKMNMGPGEMVAIEKFGVGTILGKIAAGASDAATKKKLQDVVKTLEAFQSSNVIATTDDVDVTILESANIRGETPYRIRIKYADSQMAKSGLGSTLTSDNGGGIGSFALGGVHMTGEDMIIVKISEQLDETWNDQIIKWPIIVNFGEQERYPKMAGNTDNIKNSDAELKEDMELIDMGLPLTVGYIANKYDKPLPEGVPPDTILVPLDARGSEHNSSHEDDDKETFAEHDENSPHRRRAQRQLAEYFAAIDKGILEGAELRDKQSSDAKRRLKDASTPKQADALIPGTEDEKVGRVAAIEEMITNIKLLHILMARAHTLETQGRLGEPPVEEFAEAIARLTRQEILESPFGRLINIFKERAAVEDAVFQQMTQQAKREAFSFAGGADANTVEKMRRALIRNLEAGGTLQDFVAATDQFWNSSSAHLETVWKTNAQQAYTAGVDAQFKEFGVEEYPLAELVTQGDADVREEHDVWDGFLAPPDDPVWDRMAPLNDFNCRCQKVLIHRVEVEEENLKATDKKQQERLLRIGPANPAFT